MPQPFDYTLKNVPDPTQNIMQALQIGSAIQAQKAKQVAAQQQQQLQTDIAGLGKNPTPAAVANLSAKYPQLSEQFQKTYNMLNTEQQKAHVDTASQVYASLLSGNTEVAQDVLQQRIEAARNSGDEEQAKQMETMSKLIELHPETAKTSTGIFLANAMGAEKFTDTFTKLEESRRERALEPGALKKQAAELGLTEQQTNKVLAENKKLGVETQKLALELEAMKKGGKIVDPEKRFEYERKLSDEYTKKTQNFTDVQEAYRRIKAAEDTAAGDLSLIFSYMKMLDPGSTVREGEFANAQNAGGIDDKVVNLYNQLLTGERLNADQRKSFKSQSNSLFAAARKREEDVRAGIQKVVDNYELNPENVFVTGAPEPGEAPDQNTVTFGNQTFTRPEGWTDAQWNAYKASQQGGQ